MQRTIRPQLSADSPAVFFEDIVRGGYGLNNHRLVRALADGAVPGIRELAAVGVPFARDGEKFRQRICRQYLSAVGVRREWNRSGYHGSCVTPGKEHRGQIAAGIPRVGFAEIRSDCCNSSPRPRAPRAGGGPVTSSQSGGAAAGPSVATGAPPVLAAAPVQEDDVFKVLRWLSQLGQTADQPDSPEQISAVEKDLHQLPLPGQAALAQALMSMSSQNEPPRPDDPLLVQLAERVAVRFALERFDRGDVKTNAVVELLDRLKREIGSLRNILKGHEEKMGSAGMDVESHADILDRQFWARVPATHKRNMLLSPEAWAVPPRNIRQFVEELLGKRRCGLGARHLG